MLTDSGKRTGGVKIVGTRKLQARTVTMVSHTTQRFKLLQVMSWCQPLNLLSLLDALITTLKLLETLFDGIPAIGDPPKAAISAAIQLLEQVEVYPIPS